MHRHDPREYSGHSWPAFACLGATIPVVGWEWVAHSALDVVFLDGILITLVIFFRVLKPLALVRRELASSASKNSNPATPKPEDPRPPMALEPPPSAAEELQVDTTDDSVSEIRLSEQAASEKTSEYPRRSQFNSRWVAPVFAVCVIAYNLLLIVLLCRIGLSLLPLGLGMLAVVNCMAWLAWGYKKAHQHLGSIPTHEITLQMSLPKVTCSGVRLVVENLIKAAGPDKEKCPHGSATQGNAKGDQMRWLLTTKSSEYSSAYTELPLSTAGTPSSSPGASLNHIQATEGLVLELRMDPETPTGDVLLHATETSRGDTFKARFVDGHGIAAELLLRKLAGALGRHPFISVARFRPSTPPRRSKSFGALEIIVAFGRQLGGRKASRSD
jgi:hypothetical protein